MSDKQRHYVRVCRPRFEVTIVEIDEENSDYAKIRAAVIASNLPSKAWKLLPFDAERYFPHVEECATEADMDAAAFGDESKEQLIARFRDVRENRAMAYLLLMADLESGEGDLIAEPWCDCTDPGALELDVANDWHKDVYGVFFEGDPILRPWIDIEIFHDAIDNLRLPSNDNDGEPRK